MSTFRISVPVGGMIPSNLRVDASSFMALSEAVRSVAEMAQQQWVAYATGEPLPGGGTVNRPSYARSIKLRQTGDFSAEVYASGREADEIEDGTPSRDLKKMLWTSKKTRLSAKGTRYLIIPFRWKTEGAGGVGANVMPASAANWWKGQAASRVTGWTTRVSGSGHVVPQRLYNWGSSLQKIDLSRLGIRGTVARRVMKGMVMFRQPGGKGGGSKSSFMTFRTMSESQTGKWITRPKPGLHVARQVAQQMERVAEDAFRKAIEEDINRALGRL